MIEKLIYFNNKINALQNKAFTLAEVLITLGIIGIVASLTIPTLVQKYQNQEYVIKLKKTYSQMNEALKDFTNDYGTPNDLVSTGYFDSYYQLNTMAFQRIFVKYFKTSKDCGAESHDVNESVAGCFPDETYKELNGDATYVNNIYYSYQFITQDGSAISINTNGVSPGCAGGGVGLCASVIIDVNGPQKPNRLGRDTFMFNLNSKKWVSSGSITSMSLSPLGETNMTYNKCTKTGNYPYDCTARIMINGWQMDY